MKNSTRHEQYLAERLRRTAIRKANRKANRSKKKWYYGTGDNTCPYCGGQMTWCSCCQVWSSTCCIDYGTCQCS